jgi:hypothetical protein
LGKVSVTTTLDANGWNLRDGRKVRAITVKPSTGEAPIGEPSQRGDNLFRGYSGLLQSWLRKKSIATGPSSLSAGTIIPSLVSPRRETAPGYPEKRSLGCASRGSAPDSHVSCRNSTMKSTIDVRWRARRSHQIATVVYRGIQSASVGLVLG